MMGVCFFYVIIFACHHFLVIIFRFFDDKNRRCHPIVEGQHRQNHSWRPEAKMKKKNNWSVGSEAQYEPRTAGEVLQEFLNESSSPFAQAYRQHRAVFPNTEMCVDLKLLTREPGALRIGEYRDGAITRDADDHFLFIENATGKKRNDVQQRNPHVYEGVYININQKADGTLYPTFNRPRFDDELDFKEFCCRAADELRLVAKGRCMGLG